MFKRAGVLFFYTLTPLHPGSGASVAAIDLPIQRERHTNFPMIQASGVKGALRDLVCDLLGITGKDLEDFRRLRDRPENSLTNEERNDQNRLAQKILPWEIVFGPETDRASEHGGALALTDARILLFPVRSAKGVFAWITCPGVIARLQRDLEVLGATNGNSFDIGILQQVAKLSLTSGQAFASKESDVVLVVLQKDQKKERVILEDFCFDLQQGDDQREKVKGLAQWLAGNALPAKLDYWKEKLKKDLILLSDGDFREFVEMSTEVITRVKLGEKGTVDVGPWDEEHLPSETLLYSLALASDPKLPKKERDKASIRDAKEVLGFLQNELVNGAHVMQLGGDETVGKGLVWVRYFDGQKDKSEGKAPEERPVAGGGGDEI